MMDTIKEAVSKFTTLLGSASKIVLLTFAVGTNVGLFTGHIDMQIYSAAMMMVLGFYFGTKDNNGK